MSLTVEQIINRLQAELDKDTREFLAEAHRVAQYDAILRDSHRTIGGLAERVSKLMIQQSDLDRTIGAIGSYQSELSDVLDVVESHVADLFASAAATAPNASDGGTSSASASSSSSQSNSSANASASAANGPTAASRRMPSQTPTQDDVRRERSYALAADLDRRMAELTSGLQSTVQDLNKVQEAAISSEEEVGQIIHILNTHHDTLAYLETASRSLETDVALLRKEDKGQKV